MQERALLGPMYETPGSDVKEVRIDADVVASKKAPMYFRTEKRAPPVSDILMVDDEEEPQEGTGP